MTLTINEKCCLVCGKLAGELSLAYKREGQLGVAHVDCLPLDLAIALFETSFVARSLLDRFAELPEDDEAEFSPKIKPIIAMVKYVGISASLSYFEAPLDQVEAALARMQEASLPPKGWPFGEYWLLEELLVEEEGE